LTKNDEVWRKGKLKATEKNGDIRRGRRERRQNLEKANREKPELGVTAFSVGQQPQTRLLWLTTPS